MLALLGPPPTAQAPPAGDEVSVIARRPFRVRRLARQVGKWGILAVVFEDVLLPQIVGTRNSWHELPGVNTAWLLMAVMVEAASLAVYGLLSRALFPKDQRPGYATLLAIDLSTMAASRVMPAGSAVGLGLGYRMLTRAGVSGPVAVFVKVTQAIGSAVVLNIILLIALVASTALHGFNPVFGPLALVGSSLLALAAALLVLVLHGDDRVADVLARLLGRLPRLSPDRVRVAALSVTSQVCTLASAPRRLTVAFAFAAANWLLDAAALWACLHAFGHSLGPDQLLVSYGLAAVLAAVPITPAGLGVAEAALIPVLVGFSTPRGIAILGVLAWRAIAFVLPIPIGSICYLLFQRLIRPGRLPVP